MWGTSHFAQGTVEVAERRTHPRTPVNPPIYTSLDDANGGLIFNMSEDGFALTAAMTLGGKGHLGLRIYLPDSADLIEATGQIAWRSDTGKTVGITFISLPDEARQRIRKWLAEEAAACEVRQELGELPDPTLPLSEIGLTKPQVAPLQSLLDSNTVAEKRMLEAILAEDRFAALELPARVRANPAQELAKAPDEIRIFGDTSPQLRQRRIHQRCRIRPFSYIELGKDNGGMLLNIGAGGCAVATAECVTENGYPSIRIQFTGSTDVIDVSGQIAWVSESKREAGIRFVNLTEEARRIIADRVSREEPPVEFQAQSAELQISPSQRIALPFLRGNSIPPAGATTDTLDVKFWKRHESKPKIIRATHRTTSTVGAEKLRKIAAVVILAIVVGATTVWFANSPALRHSVNGLIAQTTKETNKLAKVRLSSPTGKDKNNRDSRPQDNWSKNSATDLKPSKRSANDSQAASVPVRQLTPSQERLVAKPTNSGAVDSTVSAPSKNQVVRPMQLQAVTAPNPAPVSPNRQAAESSYTQSAYTPVVSSTNPPPSPPADLAPTVVKENPLPPVKQPDAPTNVTWSVAISTDPYPSIRVPSDISSQKVTGGRSLQIGRVVSRVEPVYPEDAKRQGIEGSVKLHIVVGRDGNVLSATPTSGPALLANAATSAVHEWRYAQTLLGGQPVETEQDVVIRFRLVSQ